MLFLLSQVSVVVETYTLAWKVGKVVEVLQKFQLYSVWTRIPCRRPFQRMSFPRWEVPAAPAPARLGEVAEVLVAAVPTKRMG